MNLDDEISAATAAKRLAEDTEKGRQQVEQAHQEVAIARLALLAEEVRAKCIQTRRPMGALAFHRNREGFFGESIQFSVSLRLWNVGAALLGEDNVFYYSGGLNTPSRLREKFEAQAAKTMARSNLSFLVSHISEFRVSSSDVLSFPEHTSNVIYLVDGELYVEGHREPMVKQIARAFA